MIRFPKMHIAASVENRILNMAGSLLTLRGAAGRATMPSAPPIGNTVPEQGAALDEALATPPATPPPVEDQLDAAAAMATGAKPLDALLGQG